jgi:hypothetical protein
MSCLSSAVARRRLVIFCARILLQCAMASSIPQTGVDEFEVRCVRGGSSNQPMARHERKPAATIGGRTQMQLFPGKGFGMTGSTLHAGTDNCGRRCAKLNPPA